MLGADITEKTEREDGSLEAPTFPFVKWAGGKQALAPVLVPHFPRTFDNYFEPFLGGGSVLLAVLPEKAFASDQNSWLIDSYNAIKQDWQAVANILDGLENNKESFLRIRKIQPDELPLPNRAAHFIYLNKTCFRGLFRVNRQGQFNVPYGAYDRRYYSPENLAAVSKALRHVEFQCCDFEATATRAKEGDFIYFDPPYFKLGGFSDFNRYTADPFGDLDHVRLASLCNELDARGVKWAVSNSDTPLIRSLFEGYKFTEIHSRREINLKSKSRNVIELLITNY